MFVILRFLRPTPILDLLEQNTSRAVPLSFVTWATTVANHQCTTAQLATAAGHREHGAHRSTTANGIDLIYHPPFLLFWHSHPPNPRSPKKKTPASIPHLLTAWREAAGWRSRRRASTAGASSLGVQLQQSTVQGQAEQRRGVAAGHPGTAAAGGEPADSISLAAAWFSSLSKHSCSVKAIQQLN